MTNIELIETQCAALSKARADLRRKHEAKMKAQHLIDGEHNDGLRESQAQCTELRATILKLLDNSREEFKAPKSRSFFGVTVGFEKQRDSVTMPEEMILVDRIEKMLPAAQAKTLLDRTVTVIKAAFKKLDRGTLLKLGCSVVANGDKPIVRTNDDDIETLVQKALGDGKEVEL